MRRMRQFQLVFGVNFGIAMDTAPLFQLIFANAPYISVAFSSPSLLLSLASSHCLLILPLFCSDSLRENNHRPY